jgi:hypothetical protein
MEKLYRLAEVKRVLAIDDTQLDRLLRSGTLGALEVLPGELRVRSSDLLRFINIRRRDHADTVVATLGRARESG